MFFVNIGTKPCEVSRVDEGYNVRIYESAINFMQRHFIL